MQSQTMGNNMNYLIKPSTESVYDDGTIENTPILSFAYGAASMQGWRKKQEDKFTCLAKFYKNFSFFGVYDGHGGAEIAEYLQESLHHEVQHYLEAVEDVELAMYLAFLAADTTLKVPEIIEELNTKLDFENHTSCEKRKKLFHKAKLLEELKKKGENDDSSKKSDVTERKETDDSTQANGTTLSQNPNAAESAKDLCSAGTTQDSSTTGVTQEPITSGATHDPSSSGSTQEPSSSFDTQDASSSYVTIDLDAGSAQGSHDADSTQEAGPSQEFNSSTEDEDTEMEDDSNEEDMEFVEIQHEQPLEYLLNEELESSDPEDEDFSYDDEETESEGSDEGIQSGPTSSKLTADEFANIQPGDLSGSTATVVLLNEKTMYVANVGDSRCVLSRKGEAIDMTIDHKPTDDEEQERIVLNGGTVRMGRVNDTIDMSRAIGDFKLKGSSLIPSEQCVTAEPTIKTLPIVIDDEFLVIASDGIWNAMTSQEVVDYVHMRLKHENCDLRDICNELFQLILSPDLENDGTGCDNMTCIIIKFIQSGVRSSEGLRIQSGMASSGRSAGLNKDFTVAL